MSQGYSQQGDNDGETTLTIPRSKSRFSHFQGLNTFDDTDGMVIVAGVGLRPERSDHRGARMPGVDGVFVTRVVDGSTTPSHFTTTVVKCKTTKRKVCFTYSPQSDSDLSNQGIGRVTICQEMDWEVKTLVQRKLKLPNDQLRPIVIYLQDHVEGIRYEINVRQGSTVKSLRKKLWRDFGIGHDEKILYKWEELENGYTLEDYNIGEGSVIHCMD